MIKNYYSILGIETTASREEVISTFRKLAKKYHPDKNSNPEATKKFKKIYEAYEILKDNSKRSEYDMLYQKYFGEKETFDKSYYDEINNWANKAQENFDKYVTLDFKDFLKVTLEKATYHGLKTLKYGIKTALFVATLLFTFITLLVVIGLLGHIANDSFNSQVLINFIVIFSIQVALIIFTRKNIISYQKQYGV